MSAFHKTFVEYDSELEDYEDSEVPGNDSELDRELDELDLSLQELEAEEEIGGRPRVPVRPLRTRPQPAARRPPAYSKPPRVIRRHPRSRFIHEPVTCICPEKTCPEHGTEYIRWVQSALNDVLGLRLLLNGVMGPETRSAVRSFQEREKLPVTGIVGPDIESALIAARGGKSPGAKATKPDEPGMTEPPESAATPPEPGMTEPAEPAPTSSDAEFDFEWETRAPLRRRPVVVSDGPGVCTCPEPSCPVHGMEQFAESGDGAGEADGFEAELFAELVDLDFDEKFDDGTFPPAPESADAVERFIGSEHRDIGDLALGQRPTSIVYDERGKRLTFGEMIALAGDYFETHFQMTELSGTREGRASIAFARWRALGLPDTLKPRVSEKIEKAIVERYFVLASQNSSHFSAGGTAWNTYMSFHSNALATAFETGEKSDAKTWQRAISKEGFACHFLTDMFAAGHVRTPRIAIRNWYRQHFPDSIDRIVKYMAKYIYDYLCKPNNRGFCTTNNLGFGGKFPLLRGKVRDEIAKKIKELGGAAIKTFSLGDIVSLALHNYDNRRLDVVTDVDNNGKPRKGGYPWTAVGDGHLKSTPLGPRTKTMAVNAVKASFRELERVRDAGKRYSGSGSSGSRADAVKKAMGGYPHFLFAAKAFVPREDPSSRKNIRLPGTGSGSSNLEWRWGKLGSVAYREVDITVKGEIAREILKQVPNVKDAGQRDAFYSFASHIARKDGGIHVLEAAVGKKAK